MSVVVARAFFVHAPKIIHTSVDVDRFKIIIE